MRGPTLPPITVIQRFAGSKPGPWPAAARSQNPGIMPSHTAAGLNAADPEARLRPRKPRKIGHERTGYLMPSKHHKRPRDFSQAAKMVVDIATGQVQEAAPTPEEQGKD